jgi:hypothetical protein
MWRGQDWNVRFGWLVEHWGERAACRVPAGDSTVSTRAAIDWCRLALYEYPVLPEDNFAVLTRTAVVLLTS